jgi:hypothetical protein
MKNLFRAESVVECQLPELFMFTPCLHIRAAMFFNRNEHQNIIHFAAAAVDVENSSFPATSRPYVCVQFNLMIANLFLHIIFSHSLARVCESHSHDSITIIYYDHHTKQVVLLRNKRYNSVKPFRWAILDTFYAFFCLTYTRRSKI